MRHFLQVGAVDPIPTLAALAVKPGLWNENPLRTQHAGTAHAEADDIWLMFNKVPNDPAEVIDDISVFPYRAWTELPHLRSLVLDLMHRVGGVQLGRVILTRLRPGKRILPHVDQGAPAEYFTRYQIALQSLPGCNFRIGDEAINFPSGSVWWIDNRTEHEVINNSADDRIVCIVDIRQC
ncbi:aspartyl/asparaginyl beta-hydroxylase domain-containing protein [Caenibius sp. WL]|uniref:aspartyl/asparaginyl beta-hydroxylase domain-containing protein n=1 Tax=Caenibius sp. WL TaxID=2872646 RepID=UPI001C994C75|nr:aspartyl/asparaginyl beta-hydroxylase domain-containing protein [Caenibius sp. WL]QZP07772.1 aspartyl/asparaginyl beta-hydroxylase domain-containing protein [Caenibius sp. WL]QZP09995.1 aspartyl/asparaginyl beta-hydroxylase domain-containing protein [Caenibius sp. WL]